MFFFKYYGKHELTLGFNLQRPIIDFFQRHRDAHELVITIPVPNQQFTAPGYVFTSLVEDLVVFLNYREILFESVTCAVDKSHPVTRASTPVHEVTQLTILKNLPDKIKQVYYSVKINLLTCLHALMSMFLINLVYSLNKSYRPSCV